METSGKPEMVVYAMGVRIAYVGELLANNEDTIKMKRVLVLEQDINPKTGEMGPKSIGPVQHASRDSEITINKRLIAGMVITAPDPELLKVYDREIMPCYSPLVTAGKSSLSL